MRTMTKQKNLYSPDQEERDLCIKDYDSKLRAKMAEYDHSQTEGDQILFRQHEFHALLLLEPVVDAPRTYNSTSWLRRVITPTIAVELWFNHYFVDHGEGEAWAPFD
jgi:hypothetical protein